MLFSKCVLRIFLFSLIVCPWTATSVLAFEDPSTSIVDFAITPSDQLLSLALEIQYTKMDCTHLVHYLYQQSGLEYVYANSSALYKGVSEFRRVRKPQAGDLIVWPGHAGIVVDPEGHTFVSALRSGVKISSYISSYWKKRGIPRFFHYVGNRTVIASVALD